MNLENTVRENLIKASNRKFGGIFEHVIEHLNGLRKANHASHDRYCDKDNKRIEMKSVRAFVRHENESQNVAEWALSQNFNKSLIADGEKTTANYNCGFCQIKPECFDLLYYSVVFHDKIYIFRAMPEDILYDPNFAYSGKQHRNGSMGQFHISGKKIAYHIENYLIQTLSYPELVRILQVKNVKINVA